MMLRTSGLQLAGQTRPPDRLTAQPILGSSRPDPACPPPPQGQLDTQGQLKAGFVRRRRHLQLVDLLIGWLVDWLIGLLVGLLAD